MKNGLFVSNMVLTICLRFGYDFEAISGISCENIKKTNPKRKSDSLGTLDLWDSLGLAGTLNLWNLEIFSGNRPWNFETLDF